MTHRRRALRAHPAHTDDPVRSLRTGTTTARAIRHPSRWAWPRCTPVSRYSTSSRAGHVRGCAMRSICACGCRLTVCTALCSRSRARGRKSPWKSCPHGRKIRSTCSLSYALVSLHVLLVASSYCSSIYFRRVHRAKSRSTLEGAHITDFKEVCVLQYKIQRSAFAPKCASLLHFPVLFDDNPCAATFSWCAHKTGRERTLSCYKVMSNCTSSSMPGQVRAFC